MNHRLNLTCVPITTVRRAMLIVILGTAITIPQAVASMDGTHSASHALQPQSSAMLVEKQSNRIFSDHSPFRTIRVAEQETPPSRPTPRQKPRDSASSTDKPWYERWDDKVDTLGCKVNRKLGQNCGRNTPSPGHNNK